MSLSLVYAFRTLMKNKSYAIINLFGLTLGLSVSIFILLYVQDELSYDKYLPGHDRVIRIQPSVSVGNGEQQWATSEGFLVPTLVSMYPEIEAGVRFLRNDNDVIIKTDSAQFSQDGVVAADSTFLRCSLSNLFMVIGQLLWINPMPLSLLKKPRKNFSGKLIR